MPPFNLQGLPPELLAVLNGGQSQLQPPAQFAPPPSPTVPLQQAPMNAATVPAPPPAQASDPYGPILALIKQSQDQAHQEYLQQQHGLGLFPDSQHPFQDHPIKSILSVIGRLGTAASEGYRGERLPMGDQYRAAAAPGTESTLASHAMQPIMQGADLMSQIAAGQSRAAQTGIEQQRLGIDQSRLGLEQQKNTATQGAEAQRIQIEQQNADTEKRKVAQTGRYQRDTTRTRNLKDRLTASSAAQKIQLQQALGTAKSSMDYLKIAEQAKAAAQLGDPDGSLNDIYQQAQAMAQGGTATPAPASGKGGRTVNWKDLP